MVGVGVFPRLPERGASPDGPPKVARGVEHASTPPRPTDLENRILAIDVIWCDSV